MYKRKIKTEADKLKEAKNQAHWFGVFSDEMIERGIKSFDKSSFVTYIQNWISAQEEIHRIESDERWAKIKKENEQLEREKYNRFMIETPQL